MVGKRFLRSCVRAGVLVAIAAMSAACAHAQEEQPSDPPAANLPEPRVLLERCIDAMGGEQAFDALKNGRANVVSTTVVGSYDVTFRWASHTRFLLEMQRDDQRYAIGCDGRFAWRHTPQAGWEVFEGSAADSMIAQVGDFLAPFQLPRMLRSGFAGATLETVEKTEFAGHLCYKVKSTTSKGFVRFLYFDAASGLFAGSAYERNDFTGGTSKIVTTLLEYKQIGPLRIYTKVHVDQGEIGASDIEFKSMEFNTVDESIFVLPEQAHILLSDSEANPTTQSERNKNDSEEDGGDF